jgi:hypothetical protein
MAPGGQVRWRGISSRARAAVARVMCGSSGRCDPVRWSPCSRRGSREYRAGRVYRGPHPCVAARRPGRRRVRPPPRPIGSDHSTWRGRAPDRPGREPVPGEQRRGTLNEGIKAESDRTAQPNRVPIAKLESMAFHGTAQAISQAGGDVRIRLSSHQEKFVSAPANERVRFAAHLRQQLLGLDDDPVPGLMAVRIVDPFEPVQVQHDKEQRGVHLARIVRRGIAVIDASAANPRQVLRNLVRQIAPVPQPRQRISDADLLKSGVEPRQFPILRREFVGSCADFAFEAMAVVGLVFALAPLRTHKFRDGADAKHGVHQNGPPGQPRRWPYHQRQRQSLFVPHAVVV